MQACLLVLLCRRYVLQCVYYNIITFTLYSFLFVCLFVCTVYNFIHIGVPLGIVSVLSLREVLVRTGR